MRTLNLTILPHELARKRLATLVPTVAAILLSACGGGAADPASMNPAGGMANAGSGMANAGSGMPTAAGGAATAGGGGSGGETGVVCPALTELTLAIHVVVDVTWPETLGAKGGSGKLNAWNLARLKVDGTSISGMTQPCGSDLPELTLSPLVGGGKFDIEVPDAIWDAPSAPHAATVGMLGGFEPGSILSTEVTSLLVGLTMPDPEGPWPASHGEVTALDSDADDKPGFTALPKSGNGYVQPPVAADLGGSGAKADALYMVSRTAMGLSGTLSSCTEQSGTVSVKFFDNHIVGCHVAGGDECSAEQVDFLDANRNQLSATEGTFTSKLVPDTATCADAREM
jgi:hypothetical protein